MSQRYIFSELFLRWGRPSVGGYLTKKRSKRKNEEAGEVKCGGAE
jgi:hypothetical protein